MSEDLYLGFDLSTQQLKAVAVRSDLKVAVEATVDFDTEYANEYGIHKGVLKGSTENEIVMPVHMWLQALDLVLSKLGESGLDFSHVKGISTAGMQHGTVFWHSSAPRSLANLDPGSTLSEQLTSQTDPAFSLPYSPNWQDSSTQNECNAFNECLGDSQSLAVCTGSKAHHRFSGPQIMRFRKRFPVLYRDTSRISLVSSFLPSLFLGKIAPIDIGDVCGMNLWNIKEGVWNQELLALAGGASCTEDINLKLGNPSRDGGENLGHVCGYFVRKYGFSTDCMVAPGTGDNLSTILSVPLSTNDAIVSLGTSTTFLMSTPEYKPDAAYHYMNHPTAPGQYMFMLCYKNGSLAREGIRDQLNKSTDPGDIAFVKSHATGDPWSAFNAAVTKCAPLCSPDPATHPFHMGLYFPLHEIVPNVSAGQWNFQYTPVRQRSHPATRHLEEISPLALTPVQHARIILESQMLALRFRSRGAFKSQSQPHRTYLVGGASVNPAIAQVVGEVLGSTDGVYRLDLGDKGCALGAAYKALWARERGVDETFEHFIGTRWRMEDFVTKVDVGYRAGLYEVYGEALEGFESIENVVREATGSVDLRE